MENSRFECATRTSGDLVAVFETDDDGTYFYLFDLTKERGQQARAVTEVNERAEELQACDVSVRWNASEDFAGLFIGGDLRAAFDQQGRRYGETCDKQKSPGIPPEISRQFVSPSGRGSMRERDFST